MGSNKLTAACGCDMGKIRKNNEDNFFFDHTTLPEENLGLENILYAKYDLTDTSGVFGVFDGMGGEADGQIASYLSATILQQNCDKLMSNSAKIKRNYEDIINQMNEAVYLDAGKRFNSMGCTAAMLVFEEKKVYLCNVGDSPIFRFRNKVLEQISQDHTDAEMLRKQGITNRKPHLTQCIGISPEEMQIQPYIYEEKIHIGDRYLICSDGLTDMVSKNEIARTLSEVQDVEDCVECLIQKALAGGGRDNITVVVIQVENGELSKKDVPRERKVLAVKYANKEHKEADLQISEEFRQALRQNDFLEEETKEVMKDEEIQAKTVVVKPSDININKKSKSWVHIIAILVLFIGIGVLGKSMFQKFFGEENEVRVVEVYTLKDRLSVEDIIKNEREEESAEKEESIYSFSANRYADSLADSVAQDMLTELKEDQLAELAIRHATIQGKIQKAFETAGLENLIDETTGRITMDANVLFGFDDATLSDEGKTLLDKFIGAYVPAILDEECVGYISEIIIEVHTDTAGGYDHNLELSENRAKAVANYLKNESTSGLTSEELEAFNQKVITEGKSLDSPVYNDNGAVIMNASGRVTFRFMLNVDEIE